jgi:hypothetical protein
MDLVKLDFAKLDFVRLYCVKRDFVKLSNLTLINLNCTKLVFAELGSHNMFHNRLEEADAAVTAIKESEHDLAASNEKMEGQYIEDQNTNNELTFKLGEAQAKIDEMLYAKDESDRVAIAAFQWMKNDRQAKHDMFENHLLVLDSAKTHEHIKKELTALQVNMQQKEKDNDASYERMKAKYVAQMPYADRSWDSQCASSSDAKWQDVRDVSSWSQRRDEPKQQVTRGGWMEKTARLAKATPSIWEAKCLKLIKAWIGSALGWVGL